MYILTLNLSDLNRTLETLQQRVQALEKNLAPFTTGYPAMQSSYGYQINSTPMTNGKFRESLMLTVIFRYLGQRVKNREGKTQISIFYLGQVFLSGYFWAVKSPHGWQHMCVKVKKTRTKRLKMNLVCDRQF